MSDKPPEIPAPPGAEGSSEKALPKSVAGAVMEKHSDKQKFDSADWAKELNKPKDKTG